LFDELPRLDRYGHVLEGLDAQAVTAVAALVDGP
jgi:hypothetical protein